MGKIYVDAAISLDGFIAGLNPGPANPMGEGGGQIHNWIYKQKAFREIQKIGGDGETGINNDLLIESLNRPGACIMGKTMFITGEFNWPEDAPFHCPVYVLTHEKREPWPRKGGTTFYFVNDGLYSALAQAKAVAGNKDIRISGDANVIQQFINEGLVDEMMIHVAPVVLGKGILLLENINPNKTRFQIAEVFHSPEVTHIRYNLKKV
ncbi:MAG TPA: dihydrofolate reductase family protein [Chitinophagaceae bacterium]|nr:dihydrofolate reductase family protein [Chitinophagaceae bacterium]